MVEGEQAILRIDREDDVLGIVDQGFEVGTRLPEPVLGQAALGDIPPKDAHALHRPRSLANRMQDKLEMVLPPPQKQGKLLSEHLALERLAIGPAPEAAHVRRHLRIGELVARLDIDPQQLMHHAGIGTVEAQQAELLIHRPNVVRGAFQDRLELYPL